MRIDIAPQASEFILKKGDWINAVNTHVTFRHLVNSSIIFWIYVVGLQGRIIRTSV